MPSPNTLSDDLRCRLYLNGVLGALPELVRLCPEARQRIEKQAYAVRFATRGGLSATVRFANGEVSIGPEKEADIVLYFLTRRQLIAFFAGKGFAVPLPLKGWLRLWRLWRFSKLAKCLQRHLKPQREALENAEVLLVHVRLTLGVVVRALVELLRDGPQVLPKGMRGTAVFRVGKEPESYAAWVRCGEELACGVGEATGLPEVQVCFVDDEVALGALEDRIDVNAEVGLGRIRVEGFAPLADELGCLMQRLPAYFDDEV